MKQSAHVLLGVILFSAVLIRIGWGLKQPTDDEAINRLPDQREYLELAQNLLHGDGLKFTDPRFGDEVFAYRTPGYPMFVALMDANVRAVRIAQALIDASTVLAVYLLAKRWLGEGSALFAAAIIALNPFLIYFSATILSETLFAAMLAWGMVFLTRRSRFGVLFGGIVLSLSVLVRPSALALPIALGLSSLFVNRTEPSAYQRRWSLPVGTTMLLLTILVLLPWAIRNQRVLGSWIWTTSNGGITMYDGFNPDATGASNQNFIKSMPQLRDMGEIERSQYLSELAKEFVRDHPRRALELTAMKIARTWSPVPLSSEFGQPKYRLVGLFYSLPLDVLVLIGLWSGALPRAAKVFLLLPAVYFTALHALSVGSLRYRIPVEPSMVVVAASCLAAVRRTALPVERSDTSERPDV